MAGSLGMLLNALLVSDQDELREAFGGVEYLPWQEKAEVQQAHVVCEWIDYYLSSEVIKHSPS